jgi:hypothetical protein
MRITAVLCSLLLAASVALASPITTAKVTFDNQSSTNLNMFVDKTFGCNAPSSTSCVVYVELGVHYFEARTISPDDKTVADSTHEVTEDATWRITDSE